MYIKLFLDSQFFFFKQYNHSIMLFYFELNCFGLKLFVVEGFSIACYNRLSKFLT